MTASKIEWTTRSDWNAVRGCTRVSPGCGGPGPHGGCYAENLAARFSKPGEFGQWGLGFAEMVGGKPRWTGRVELVEERLTLPLRWARGVPGCNQCFITSTSDPFHENLPFEAIDRLFAVMALRPDWIFQVLTKRSARMREYCRFRFTEGYGQGGGGRLGNILQEIDRLGQFDPSVPLHWPLRNVWLGVSVEDQERADERREDLRAAPAAVKFVSYEPALGPVDWTGWDFVHQIISGGEGGPRARAAHPAWFRNTRDWCAPRGVAYFHKQNGEWASVSEVEGPGGHHSFPDGAAVRRVGKKAAGRLLDGVEHSGMPA